MKILRFFEPSLYIFHAIVKICSYPTLVSNFRGVGRVVIRGKVLFTLYFTFDKAPMSKNKEFCIFPRRKIRYACLLWDSLFG